MVHSPLIEVNSPLNIHKSNQYPKLEPLIHSAIRYRSRTRNLIDDVTLLNLPQPKEKQPFWNAEHFHLHTTSLFNSASQKEQQEMLHQCSKSTLFEAYCIEKSGMTFTAKMALLSTTVEERMAYCLFSSDEATHFHWMSSALEEFYPQSIEELNSTLHHDPFLSMLNQLIQEGDRTTLIFMIQILLEGWGIHHYHQLAKNCLNPSFQSLLQAILKDEARHHGSGLVLFNQNQLSARQRDHLLDLLLQFFSLVRMGPQGIVNQIETVKGKLSQKHKTKLFSEMNAEGLTYEKLKLLQNLIHQSGYESIHQKLDDMGQFTPLDPSECAQIAS